MMIIEELIEQLQIYKEETKLLIQIKGPGPKGGIIQLPIKEIIANGKFGYVSLVAKEQGDK